MSGVAFSFIWSLMKPVPRSPSHATTPTRVVGVPRAGVRKPETVVLTVAPPCTCPKPSKTVRLRNGREPSRTTTTSDHPAKSLPAAVPMFAWTLATV